MRYLPLIALALVLACVPAMGASSFLGGFSGNIMTPDAVIEPVGTWELSYHQFTNLLGDSDDLKAIGLITGITPNLEVGVSFLDNSESDTTLNAKYRLIPETTTRPEIIVGAFDIAGTADFLDGDPGLFILLSKNITRTASEVAGEPSKPLRLTAGFGGGVFDGFFAGLDWTLHSNLSIMAEFFGGTIGEKDSFFSAGARYAPTSSLRLDAALVDFDELAFGASYRQALR